MAVSGCARRGCVFARLLKVCYQQTCSAQVDRTERSLRTALREQRREEQRAKQGGLNPHQAKVAVAVYILSDYDLVIAGSFALQKTRGSVSNSAEDLGNTVRDMSLAMPLDSLVRYLVPVDHKDEAIRAAVLKFIAQHKAYAYVADANTNKGVAPSSHDTASEYIRQCDKLGVTTTELSLRRALDNGYTKPQTSRRRIRKWSQKFRVQWGSGFGPLRTRNPLPEAELVEKAGLI